MGCSPPASLVPSAEALFRPAYTHTKLEGVGADAPPSARSTIPFFMDSRNSGAAPAGHIQTFD